MIFFWLFEFVLFGEFRSQLVAKDEWKFEEVAYLVIELSSLSMSVWENLIFRSEIAEFRLER